MSGDFVTNSYCAAMFWPVKKSNIFSSDNTKKYDRQVGFLATVKKFHFYLIAKRFPVKLTRNLVSYRQSLLSSFIKGSESVELTSAESILNVWPVTAYIRMRVDPWDVLNLTN